MEFSFQFFFMYSQLSPLSQYEEAQSENLKVCFLKLVIDEISSLGRVDKSLLFEVQDLINGFVSQWRFCTKLTIGSYCWIHEKVS